jgi:hypothetical protein
MELLTVVKVALAFATSRSAADSGLPFVGCMANRL